MIMGRHHIQHGETMMISMNTFGLQIALKLAGLGTWMQNSSLNQTKKLRPYVLHINGQGKAALSSIEHFFTFIIAFTAYGFSWL